jgi:hypothetical protein
MATAFVLGNGLSRTAVSAEWLSNYGKIYGCNALHREFTPDVLVATDKPIATHIQELGIPQQTRFYTRKPIAGSGALPLPHKYHGYSSGPNAVALAALDNHTSIYLLGFDLGPTTAQKFNNIYAGTEFYKPKDAIPTFFGNWAKQMCQIITDFPLTQFHRVYGETTAEIAEFRKLTNLEHLDTVTFLSRINK